jgi:nitronate monooxygenase
MAFVAGGRLAAAVRRAGGMGLVGGGYGDPAWIDEQLTIAHPVDVGVGLITWALEQHPNTLPRLLRRGTSPIWLSFGDPSPYVEPIHHAGSTVIAQVNGVAEAVAAVAAGADVIVAQGSEAGGHGVDRPSLSALLPDVIEAAAPVPVLAAGGIGTGRQLAELWRAGAAGAALGTVLYASHEALDTPAAKQLLVERTAADTARHRTFDILRGPDWPSAYTGRSLMNETVRRWAHQDEQLRRPDVLAAERATYRRAVESDDLGRRVVWAGTSVDHVDDVQPAATIIHRIMDEASHDR